MKGVASRQPVQQPKTLGQLWSEKVAERRIARQLTQLIRSFTGLVPKASETGDTDRKGQAMSKAGSSLLRTTLVRAADNARKVDPQLARIY